MKESLFKSMLPRGSKFTPKKLLKFMKKKRLSVKVMQAMLSDIDRKKSLFDDVCRFMGYATLVEIEVYGAG